VIRAVAIAALLAALACAVATAPAGAGVVAPQDAAELAQSVAEAQEEQGICYGWAIDNNFDTLAPDYGSSVSGPGAAGDFSRCEKGYIELTGSIEYACESCDESDRAMVGIESNLPNHPTVEDLEKLGLDAGDLTGDNDDTTLINMVNALPLLAADRGLAPYVPYEPATAVPAADHATGKPGSDLLRDTWPLLAFCAFLILAGPGFYFYKRSQGSC
jgi:hypothetical protein